MSKSGLIGTWLGVFVVVATVLGAIEHASKVDPARIETAHVAVRGVVIPPFE
jgi:hypothetical protein